MRGLVGSVFIYLIVLTTSHAGPLHDAVSKGDLVAIAAALDAGADIEEQDKGATPLFLAVRSDHPQAAELLIERGANVNHESAIGLPITGAVLKSSPDLIRILLAHGVIIKKPEPISAKLANGDPAKGAAFFASNCAGCHVKRPQDVPNKGPNLWNVVGRDKASTKFGGYSRTLSDWEGSWTYEDLNIFIAGPSLTTPGVNMDVRGAPEEIDRVNVIAYLRTLSDNPVPLP